MYTPGQVTNQSIESMKHSGSLQYNCAQALQRNKIISKTSGVLMFLWSTVASIESSSNKSCSTVRLT